MKKHDKLAETSRKRKEPPSSRDENICFVLSPIGEVGTEVYARFRDVLDYVIKPAVKGSGYKLTVVRADDIERAGSFIKDILQSVLNSFVVVADLTGQNPNVFYELGVRHSLSPRTILIAQSIDDIPSDLREYRTIIYDTTAKGVTLFQERLSNYLKEIFDDPHRPDNPVLDRLESVVEQRTIELERENAELKEQISNILKKGAPVQKPTTAETVSERVVRILNLKNADKKSSPGIKSAEFMRTIGEKKKSYQLPAQQGNFNLYFLLGGKTKEGGSYHINEYWYVSIIEHGVDWARQLADVRVLMENCSKEQKVECLFVIATNDDLSSESDSINAAFQKMKTFIKEDARRLFDLAIWDRQGLLEKEKELGIRIDM